MKIIFLDIDGVLNNWNSMEEDTWVQALDFTNWDINALIVLQSIVDATEAKIVISSSWRKLIGSSIDWWNYQFRQADLDAECIGITCSVSNGFRGEEVHLWLEEHKPEAYVILDDDRDFHPGQNLVHVDGKYGLLPEHGRKAVEILLDNA